MAEEGNLGLARALDADEDVTKADLQRRMEEARESISQSVTEIKDTVANQYNSVKESVTDALDWREQFRKRPVAFTIGAIGVGILVGYRIGGLVEGDQDRVDYNASDQAGGPSAFTDEHSFATHARATAAASYEPSDLISNSRPSYSSGYEQTPSVEDKPGLIGRFKETRAYDRLQEEVSDLGNRFMDELSNAARTIVLPVLFNKVKEMIGVDLSNKRQSKDRTSQQAGDDKGIKVEKLSRGQSQTQAASEATDNGPSLGGKPAYPATSGSLNKFDRLAPDSKTPVGQAANDLLANNNYDDRYERESKLFSRGENRGFGARTGGENKTPSSDTRRSDDRDDVPQGPDFTYEPSRSSDDAKS